MKYKTFVFCLAFMSPLVTVKAQNLIQNPGFEEGSANWRYAAECGEVKAGAGRNGSAGFVYRRTDPADYHVLRQEITLEPGRRYRFTAWGKPATPETSAGNIGIILEFSRKGVFLGTQYLGCTPEKGSDWRFYESVFTAGAAGTAYSLGIYMPQGSLGAFVADDLVIEPMPSQWRFALVHPWGATAQPGDELSFTSIYNDLPIAEQTVSLTVQKGESTVWEQTCPLRKDGTLRVTLPAWQPGDYHLLATLKDKGGTIRGTEDLPLKVVSKRSRKVEMSENGSLIVEGKPFYPIGAYTNGHFDNTEHEEMAALGYTCSLAYPVIADWSKLEDIEKYVGELDKCHRLGLKVIFCLKFHFDQSTDPASFRKMVGPWVERVKSHPALLAYYLMDEPVVAKAPVATACRRWLNTADPDHPVIAVFCNQMNINDFLNGVDITATDIYPFGNKTHDVQRQLMNLGAVREHGLPIWLVAQSYDMGNVIDADHYYPTAMEILAQGMAGYISDAGGLLYWSYYHIKRAAEPEKRLAEMKWAVGILKDVAPFALTRQSAEPPAWLAKARAEKTVFRFLENGRGEARLLVLAPNTPGTFRAELPEGVAFIHSATGLTTLETRTLIFRGEKACDCDAIALRLPQLETTGMDVMRHQPINAQR